LTHRNQHSSPGRPGPPLRNGAKIVKTKNGAKNGALRNTTIYSEKNQYNYIEFPLNLTKDQHYLSFLAKKE
jgi:hypothetical protein